MLLCCCLNPSGVLQGDVQCILYNMSIATQLADLAVSQSCRGILMLCGKDTKRAKQEIRAAMGMVLHYNMALCKLLGAAI
jgi:hypothetical protein